MGRNRKENSREVEITPEMLSAGREVLQSWMSFWEVREPDYVVDQLLLDALLAMGLTKDHSTMRG